MHHNYSLKGFERMREINLAINNLEYDQHECDSFTEGEWVVFRCPICRDYERRINAVTGEMKVKKGGSTARHTGRHFCCSSTESMAQLN
jgi:hypothetical protein